jgi:hypothetical protein
MVLQWCYKGVTIVLRWCCKGVTIVLCIVSEKCKCFRNAMDMVDMAGKTSHSYHHAHDVVDTAGKTFYSYHYTHGESQCCRNKCYVALSYVMLCLTLSLLKGPVAEMQQIGTREKPF